MEALRKPNIFFALISLSFYTLLIGCAIASDPYSYLRQLPIIVYIGVFLGLLDIFHFRSESLNFFFRLANFYVFFLCGILTAYGLYFGFQYPALFHDFAVIMH